MVPRRGSRRRRSRGRPASMSGSTARIPSSRSPRPRAGRTRHRQGAGLDQGHQLHRRVAGDAERGARFAPARPGCARCRRPLIEVQPSKATVRKRPEPHSRSAWPGQRPPRLEQRGPGRGPGGDADPAAPCPTGTPRPTRRPATSLPHTLPPGRETGPAPAPKYTPTRDGSSRSRCWGRPVLLERPPARTGNCVGFPRPAANTSAATVLVVVTSGPGPGPSTGPVAAPRPAHHPEPGRARAGSGMAVSDTAAPWQKIGSSSDGCLLPGAAPIPTS